MKTTLAVAAVLSFTGSVLADTIDVPAGGDIQAAIDSASGGDVIQLAAGEYIPEATIDTLGKVIMIIGVAGKGKDDAPTTLINGELIDGQLHHSVFFCNSGEGADTVFENLVIQNGAGNVGGGMRNYNSSPTLTNCTFTGNTAINYGGGMYNYNNSSPTLNNCTFTGNLANYGGGGMYNFVNSSPTLTNCTFTNNTATNYGGGMFNGDSCDSTLTGCTFTENTVINVNYGGGGMYNQNNSNPSLTNCTVCGNTPDQINDNWTDNGGNTVGDECSQSPCPVDVNGDGLVNAADLGMLLAAWGLEGDTDINGDGITDAADLGLLLSSWGPCP